MSRFRGFTVGDSPGELYVVSFRASVQCLPAPIRSFINTRIWNACPVQTAARTTLNCRIAFPPRVSPSLVYFAVLDLVLSCNRDFCPVKAYSYTRRSTADVTERKNFLSKKILRQPRCETARLISVRLCAYCYYDPSVKLDWNLTDFPLEFLVLFFEVRTKKS